MPGTIGDILDQDRCGKFADEQSFDEALTGAVHRLVRRDRGPHGLPEPVRDYYYLQAFAFNYFNGGVSQAAFNLRDELADVGRALDRIGRQDVARVVKRLQLKSRSEAGRFAQLDRQHRVGDVMTYFAGVDFDEEQAALERLFGDAYFQHEMLEYVREHDVVFRPLPIVPWEPPTAAEKRDKFEQIAKNPHHQMGAPCPKCGKPLRTAKAQQCFSCGAKWHGGTAVT